MQGRLPLDVYMYMNRFFGGVNCMQVGRQLGLAEYSSNGDTFGGLVNLSMIVEPISMISALAFYIIYQNNNSKIL